MKFYWVTKGRIELSSNQREADAGRRPFAEFSHPSPPRNYTITALQSHLGNFSEKLCSTWTCSFAPAQVLALRRRMSDDAKTFESDHHQKLGNTSKQHRNHSKWQGIFITGRRSRKRKMWCYLSKQTHASGGIWQDEQSLTGFYTCNSNSDQLQ